MKTGCNPLQSDCVYRQQFMMLSWAHVWTSFIQSCFYKVLNLATALLVKDRALWVFLFHSKSWFCHLLLLVNMFTFGVFGVFLSIPPLFQSINIPSSCCFRLSVCQKELANYYTVFHLCFTQHPNCFLVWVVLCVDCFYVTNQDSAASGTGTFLWRIGFCFLKVAAKSALRET